MSAELEFDSFESIKLMHYSHICTPVNCWYSVLFLCTNERRNSNVEPWSHAQGCCHRQSCTQKSIDIEFYVFTIKKIDTKNTQTESFAWSENLVICSKKYKYNVQTGFVSFNMIIAIVNCVFEREIKKCIIDHRLFCLFSTKKVCSTSNYFVTTQQNVRIHLWCVHLRLFT